MLRIQPYHHATRYAYNKRIRDEPEGTPRQNGKHIDGKRAKPTRHGLPQEGDADIHQEEEQPHECTGKRTGNQNTQKKEYPVEGLGEIRHRAS